MALKVNPYPRGPFLMNMGGFREPMGEMSLEGEVSRELVLEVGDTNGC